MPKFRVANGKHIGYGPDGSSEYTFNQGDVLESKVDLTEKFANKFIRVSDDTPTVFQSEEKKKRKDLPKTLEEMTLDQLKMVAEEMEIDLKGETNKSKIIKLIKSDPV